MIVPNLITNFVSSLAAIVLPLLAVGDPIGTVVRDRAITGKLARPVANSGPIDSGLVANSGPIDSGLVANAGSVDSGLVADAGPIDSGLVTDAGSIDTGLVADAGSIDTGLVADAGSIDTGLVADAGSLAPGGQRSGSRARSAAQEIGCGASGNSPSDRACQVARSSACGKRARSTCAA